MGRIGLAFRAFFRVLFDKQTNEPVRRALAAADEVRPDADTAAAPEPPPEPEQPPEPKPPATRSDALTVLAALQREARFVDFLKESLDGLSNEQIGAAVRDVHRDCAAVVDRMFALKPVLEDAEGARVDLPAKTGVGRYRLTGNVTDTSSPSGTLVHHGWEAARCDVPEWTGEPDAARIVAPAEVEVA